MTAPRTIPRRTFLAALGAGATALATTSCSDDSNGSQAAADLDSAGDPAQASGELDVWVLQEDAVNPVSRASLDRFFGGTDVKANLITEPNESYRDVLQTIIDQDERPDIFFNWGGGSIRSYVRAGLVEDLTPYLEEDSEFKNAFLQSVLQAGQIDGAYYGIPMRTMQPKLMFYNTALFDQVGLEVPTTWQDFLDAVDAFAAEDITPVAVGAADQWPLLMWFEYLTDRLGGAQVFQDIAEGTGEGWAHPAITRTVETIRDLVDRGAFGDAFASVAYDDSGPLLSDGRAAMMLSGSWEYTNFLEDAPGFVTNSLAWGPFPALEDGEGDPENVAGNPTNYFSVHADSPLKEVAINYLKQEMASDTYVQDLLDVGDIPAVANIETLIEGHEHEEYFGFVYAMAANAPNFQLSWDQAIARPQAQPMLEAMENVFLGNLDAEGFVQANEDAAS
ncbi:carbohydrate ABC transporter substrate-binding protein (CUT1 family) [Haloactinopolyspora alba]|uniref:Carbohydrate ABC transporter substrate-binding protein (CUT1 family) n=1 Tax=Haloactinopolyspora alba TaxID=648780 RepID=A0A2P8D9D8_9ACTN|nr:extracellular solute-binding protein [Haloactinopolyspora alba]PSK93834.1 carbohydrate ABC transporter substrate-binding protein (CUT1 family) [Haloactinopolyspora alba]